MTRSDHDRLVTLNNQLVTLQEHVVTLQKLIAVLEGKRDTLIRQQTDLEGAHDQRLVGVR